MTDRINLRPVASTGMETMRGFGRCTDGSPIYEFDVPAYPPNPRGRRLRELRVSLGIGVREAAALWGIDSVRVYGIEANGSHECDWDAAERLLRGEP